MGHSAPHTMRNKARICFKLKEFTSKSYKNSFFLTEI